MSSLVTPGLVRAGDLQGASDEISTPQSGRQASDGAAGSITPIEVAQAGVVDLDQFEDLREIFGAEAFAKLLVKFGEDLRRRLETMNGATSRTDIASTAHAMISSAGSLGFTAFSDLCRTIERMADGDGDMEQSIVALATSSDHVLRTIASIAGSPEP